MQFSEELTASHPGLLVGTLRVDGLDSRVDQTAWTKMKQEETAKLRARLVSCTRKEMLGSSPFCQYAGYFKKFKKTYPVLLQVESIAFKGRDLSASCPAIETLFLAEVVTGLLAAGHDYSLIEPGYKAHLATGGEILNGFSGERTMKAGDICLLAGNRVLSSVLEGQDAVTGLTETTESALFVAYGLDGMEEKRMADFFSLLGSYIVAAFPDAVLHEGKIYNPEGPQ